MIPAAEAFDAAALRAAEARLPAFLRGRRWFGAKSRELASARISEVFPLAGVGRTGALAIALAEVAYARGSPERYQLVIAAGPGGAIELDALGDPAAGRALRGLIAERASLERGSGRIAGERAPALGERHLAAQPIRPLGGEQSNSSVVFGDAVILKVIRRLEPGENPEVELGRFLTVEADFPHAPRFLGAIELIGREGPVTLAVAQELVPDGVDGWEDALAAAGRGLDGEPTAIEAYGDAARALGAVTAALHAALAKGRDPALVPEPIDEGDISFWRASVHSRLARVERALDRPGFEAVRHAAAEVFARLESVRDFGRKIRHHGDYHLGQVLRRPAGFTILDLEGEPARPIAERRRKTSALRDVAGMLRSFDYAAQAALLGRAAPGSGDWVRLEPIAARFEATARGRFLDGYHGAAAAAPILPPDPDARARVLSVFELEKALYEVGYELDHRPAWVRIPLRGIERLRRS